MTEEQKVEAVSNSFDREMVELERSFPMISVAGGWAMVQWLQAIVEECLGNLSTIQNYLIALGITVPVWMQPILDWLVKHYKGAKDFEAPLVDAKGMTCTQAFTAVGAINADCAKVARFMQSDRHPLVSRIIENRCLAAYKRAHPGMDMKAIDWQSIITWITTNGPAIMQFIMMLIGLFGV